MEPSISLNISKNLFETNDDSCVFRCVNCLKIPLVNIFEDNNEPKIKYICECTLSEKNKYKIISIQDFLQKFIILSLKSMMCCGDKCTKDNEQVKEMDLCLTCKKPFCDECIKEHKKNNPGHEIIDINKIDNYCHIHNGEKIIAWCIRCKNNLCSDCFTLHEERCEYRIIDEIKLKNDELENYKKILKGIVKYLYDGMKIIKNNMIKKCKDDNEKKEINDLYQKYFEINENMSKLAQLSILTYIYYQDKYTYPIIQNTKNLCNFTKAIKFNPNGTIEEYKNYLKKQFIIQYSKIEEPEKRIVTEEERKKIIDEIFRKFSNDDNNFNADELYQGYSLYSYVDNPTKTNISKLTCVKTINGLFGKIYFVLLLDDKRFALTIGKEIKIFETNEFKVVITLKGHEFFINTLDKFKGNNNKLASGDIKGNIKLWIFDDNNYQCIGNIISDSSMPIIKLIHLSNGNLLSLTFKCLEIWKSDTPYNNIKRIFPDENVEFLSSLETDNNKLVVGMKKGILKIFNPDDLSIIRTFEDIFCSSINNIIQIDKNRIAVGGEHRIRIINIEKLKLEKIIVCKKLVTALILLKDNTFLAGEDDSALRQYDIETCSYIGEIVKSCLKYPVCLSQINDQFIISANVDSANFWQY